MVLLLLAGLLLWRWQADDPYVAPPPDAPAAGVDSAAASETLRQLQAALVAGDADAARALGADDESAGLLAAATDNVTSLRLDDIGLRYLSETDAATGGDGWSAEVEVTWRLRDFDGTAAARAPVVFGFADGGARIRSVGGEGELSPLWLQGPVVSRRGGGALVMSLGSEQQAEQIHRRAREAVAVTRGRFTGPIRLVVEVPDSVTGLHHTIGAAPGTYDGIAAVTTGADGSTVPGTPLHIFLNPAVYAELGALAAQVVMTHEAVHAVTEAPFSRRVPLWLLEGFADFVALRDVDLPIDKSAGQILDQVREEGVPDALPSRVDFDTESGHLGATYEAAWQVCEVLAERRGADALVGLYEAVLAGSDLAAELEARFGWTEADLLAAWQERLRTLANGG